MTKAYQIYLKGVLPHVSEDNLTQEVFDEYEHTFADAKTIYLWKNKK